MRASSSLLAAPFMGLAAAFAGSSGAEAQPAERFYKGKTVVVYSGHSASGAYSAYSRMLERHIGK